MEDQVYNCLCCGHVGKEVGDNDECGDCGEQVTPEESPDGNCPHCGHEFLWPTCPKCEAGKADFDIIETMYGTGGWVNKKEYRAEQVKLKSSAKAEGFLNSPK